MTHSGHGRIVCQYGIIHSQCRCPKTGTDDITTTLCETPGDHSQREVQLHVPGWTPDRIPEKNDIPVEDLGGRVRIKLGVYVNLDPLPGAMDSPDSAQGYVKGVLRRSLGHYNPDVMIDSRNVGGSHPTPPAEPLLMGIIDEVVAAAKVVQQKFDDVEPAANAIMILMTHIGELEEERKQGREVIDGDI